MQLPVSIVICGHEARCREIARSCTDAGIHPTLLLPGPTDATETGLENFSSTSDPFSCVADMVIDRSDDDAETVIARCNQLAEINHSDVVFALNAAIADLEAAASRIMHPGRVIAIDWNPSDASMAQIHRTSQTNDATFNITSLFIQMLQKGNQTGHAAPKI